MMMMVGQTQDADVMFMSKGRLEARTTHKGTANLDSGGISVGAVGGLRVKWF
jgi:hypothetical protein